MSAAPLQSTLPPTFAFSQSALQSFANCPRQFWLAWLSRLPWPAAEAAPALDHEIQMRLGNQFHHMVERVELGVVTPADPLSASALSEDSAGLEPPLREWYDAYLDYRPADLPTEVREVEFTLSTPVDLGDGRRVRLVAKYDLLSAERGGRAVIVDWKTGERAADRAALLLRMQSVVYPFVLVEASPGLSWGPVQPQQVEMLYWFASAPQSPVRLPYSIAQHEANRRLLVRMLTDILARQDEEQFAMVPDSPENRRRHCRFCIYRSRCDRGEPGSVLELDDDSAFDAASPSTFPSLDAVEEVAY